MAQPASGPSGSGGLLGGKHKSRSRYSGGPGAKSSRKISLTCQSVKPEFLIPAVPVGGVKGTGGAALLDPTRKSSSGRLKSPLPSPIPSPVPSPIPSPSRSRFQVSRVQETASLSPLTPPSSTSSSPTNSISRFRVTAVQESKAKTTVLVRSHAMTIPSSSVSGGNSVGNNNGKAPEVLLFGQPKSQPQEGNIFFGTTPPSSVEKQLSMAKGSGGGGGRESNKRLQSVSLDTISSSLDSPDLEVKRIMMLDDSSSIGSLDSYNAQFVPAASSLSSTESLDVISAKEEEELPAHLTLKMSIDSSVESISEKCNNLVLQEPPTTRKVCTEVEGTEGATKHDKPMTSAAAPAARTRKTSWIPANQATIDKLMSIFQNPFSRQSSPNDGHHLHHHQGEERVSDGQLQHLLSSSSSSSSTAQVAVLSAGNEPCPSSMGHLQGGAPTATATRKDNSLGNLFNWAASGMKRDERDKSSSERLAAEEATTSKQQGVLIQRSKSESNNNTINSSTTKEGGGAAAGGGAVPSPSMGDTVFQLESELISDSLMNEIKENISPEHTITANSVQQQQQQNQQLRSPLGQSGGGPGDNENKGELVRVKFKLGSTEDFDDLLMAEDEELLLESPQRVSSVSTSGLTSDDSCLSLDVEGGIGQIARDSMVMFNTSGGSSGGGGGTMKASSPITSKGE